MKRLRGNQRGFTLLELLVAISLLAIGLLATASMQGVALNSNSLANRISVGALIGQQVMEDIVSWRRDDIRLKAASVDAPFEFDPLTAATTVSVPGAGVYSATYSVTPNTPVPNVSRIVVRVTKTDELAGAETDVSTKGALRVVALTSFKRTQ